MKHGTIHLKNETLARLNPYCLTRGVPLPPGTVKRPSGVSVTDAKGRTLPSEGKLLQRRPDGSVEWMLLDILVPLRGQEAKDIHIVPRRGTTSAPTVRNPVKVRDDRKRVTLSNGLSSVVIPWSGGSLVDQLVVNGKTIVDKDRRLDLEVVDTGGKIYRASLAGPYDVTVTHRNPLRTEVRIEGTHQARDGDTFMDFALRFTLTADSPDVKLEHTFYCREPREGKIHIRAMRLVVDTTMDGGATKLIRQLHHGHNWTHRDVEIEENVEVVASSVGDIDNYAAEFQDATATHPCAGGSVFIRNMDSLREDWSEYPFHMRPGEGSGFRADLQISGVRGVSPVIGWKEKRYTFVTAFEHFRQLHPKSIEIDESRITYHLWPEWSNPMEVVQGVSKSHILWMTGQKRALKMDDVIETLHRWEYGYVEPVDVSFDPAWFAHCEVLDCQHLMRHQPEKYPLLENLIEPVPSAGNPDRHTYDRQPATGMFHFGDVVVADATNCVNNEDDVEVFFPLQHFLRTGQTYAWDYGKEAARHYMEVDFCEWSTDPKQKGGLIPHTGQHFIGNVYPSHQWVEGILAYYYLSGDERARHVVVSAADNQLWWTYNNTEMVCCDGREAGMPLVNFAAAYRLTRDEKYIKAAKHIIKNFYVKWEKKYGSFKYPYPQGTASRPYKLITGYGDWSSFAGLYRLWEASGDEAFRKLGIRLLDAAVRPGGFSLNDARGMDFLAAWALGRMTGDLDDVIKRVESAIPMLLRRGGHPMRRMHFLKELDERGLINDQNVGNRSGVI